MLKHESQATFLACALGIAAVIIIGLVTGEIKVKPHETYCPEEPAVTWRVTAYCPCEVCCGKWADGITASGHVIKPGDKFVAAPPEIPFGTMLTIPGYGRVPVLDRGGSIKGRRLDVFFDDCNGVSGHQRALNWGVRQLEVK